MSLDRWTETTLDGVRVNLTSVHRGFSPARLFWTSLLLTVFSTALPLVLAIASLFNDFVGGMWQVTLLYGPPFALAGLVGMVGSRFGLVPPLQFVDISQHSLRVEEEGETTFTIPLASITALAVQRSRIIVNTTEGVHSFRVHGRSKKTLHRIRNVLDTHIQAFQVKTSSADIPQHLRAMRQDRSEGDPTM